MIIMKRMLRRFVFDLRRQQIPAPVPLHILQVAPEDPIHGRDGRQLCGGTDVLLEWNRIDYLLFNKYYFKANKNTIHNTLLLLLEWSYFTSLSSTMLF